MEQGGHVLGSQVGELHNELSVLDIGKYQKLLLPGRMFTSLLSVWACLGCQAASELAAGAKVLHFGELATDWDLCTNPQLF